MRIDKWHNISQYSATCEHIMPLAATEELFNEQPISKKKIVTTIDD